MITLSHHHIHIIHKGNMPFAGKQYIARDWFRSFVREVLFVILLWNQKRFHNLGNCGSFLLCQDLHGKYVMQIIYVLMNIEITNMVYSPVVLFHFSICWSLLTTINYKIFLVLLKMEDIYILLPFQREVSFAHFFHKKSSITPSSLLKSVLLKSVLSLTHSF